MGFAYQYKHNGRVYQGEVEGVASEKEARRILNRVHRGKGIRIQPRGRENRGRPERSISAE